VPVDVDTGASGRRLIRANGEGVSAKFGLTQDDHGNNDHDGRNHHQQGQPAEEAAGADPGLHIVGNIWNRLPTGDDLAEPKGHAQGAKGYDEGWKVQLRDHHTVECAPEQPAKDRRGQSNRDADVLVRELVEFHLLRTAR
jgi:hypothetical protein